jgi:hypothetical protein
VDLERARYHRSAFVASGGACELEEERPEDLQVGASDPPGRGQRREPIAERLEIEIEASVDAQDRPVVDT